MKVVRVDNFARESIPDREIDHGLTADEARELAHRLNSEQPPDGPWFYRAVEDSYRLSRGMEDLV